MPGTLDRHRTFAILDYLDQALEQTRKHDGPRLECHASWCIGRARDELLRAVLADVTAEPIEPELAR